MRIASHAVQPQACLQGCGGAACNISPSTLVVLPVGVQTIWFVFVQTCVMLPSALVTMPAFAPTASSNECTCSANGVAELTACLICADCVWPGQAICCACQCLQCNALPMCSWAPRPCPCIGNSSVCAAYKHSCLIP